MVIKISKEQQMFVAAMLIIRSSMPKSRPEYKAAKKFLKEWYKKQGVEVSFSS